MPDYFDIEVTLADIQPRCWRRFLLDRGATFAELHDAIQVAFGWGNCHLFEFREPGGGEAIAGLPDGHGSGPPVPDAERLPIEPWFTGKRDGCFYVYDFGDDWLHQVRLQGAVSEEGDLVRRLLGGARACPPEDCGGLPGYERFVEFVETGKDPWGEEAEELREWLGDWSPGAFDLDTVRRRFDE